MDIHRKSVDMDMDMDVKFHIHGNPDDVSCSQCLLYVSELYSSLFALVYICSNFRQLAVDNNTSECWMDVPYMPMETCALWSIQQEKK